MPEATGGARRWRTWLVYGIGGLVGLCVVCGIIGSLLPDRSPNTNPRASATAVISDAKSPAARVSAPTETPQPTPTAAPTLTLEMPTDAPTPTITLPTPEPPPTVGLGVSRAAVQRVYERPAVGFRFNEAEPVRDQPRVMGTAPNGLAFVELIGPPDDLTKATIIVTVPKDNPTAIQENSIYMLGLVTTVMPDWSDGPTWVSQNITKAINSSEAVTTVQGKRQVSLQAFKELGIILLSIEPTGA